MRYTLYVLLAAVLWSTGGLGVKSVDMAPLALAGFRSAFAIPVLAIAALVEMRRSGTNAIVIVKRPLVWGAAISYAVMVVSFVIAAKLTTAANAIILQYTGPIYVALLSWPLLRERVRAADVVATFGCFIGMILLVFAPAIEAVGAVGRALGDGRVGDLVAIVSSFGFAGVPLLMRLDHRRGPIERGHALAPLIAMVLGNAIACAVCAPSMLHSLGGSTSIGGAGWSTLAFLGTFQIGVAYVLYGAAVNRLAALRSTLIATIEPVLNPLWVAIVRGERPSKWAAIGGAIILASVTAQAIFRGSRANVA